MPALSVHESLMNGGREGDAEKGRRATMICFVKELILCRRITVQLHILSMRLAWLIIVGPDVASAGYIILRWARLDAGPHDSNLRQTAGAFASNQNYYDTAPQSA
ncbi:hypothetical protein Dimus_022954 [Dionaea muscipula]